MRITRFFIILGLITSSFFCHAQYILTLHLSEMDPYLGKSFHVRVTEIGSGWEVGRKAISSIDTADFSLDLYVLLSPHNYNIDFYVDVNANGDYDPPLTDHAWRRIVNNPEKDTIVDFHPGKTYTDIAWRDVFPYNTYKAVWGGKWMNLTFGTTDSVEAGFDVRCDSIVGFFKTKGAFGNPAPVEYHSANPRPPDGTLVPDTLRYSVIPPWSGDIYFTNGDLYGDLSLATLGFKFRGTVGEKQMLGLYTVSNSGIQFANGFFYVRELEIISSTEVLEITLDTFVNINCTGLNDGIISVEGQGGTPGYTFLWSDSLTTPTISSLAPGQYNVSITDSEGCSTNESFIITEPEPLEVALDFLTAITCDGLNNGSISVVGEGGTPGYSYLWSIGLTTPEITSLPPGLYSVTITDANGCTASNSFQIDQLSALNIDLLIVTPESCAGACDGTITIDVTGGTPPYSYNIPNDLCEGNYTLTVTDANGCLVQEDFFIFSAPEIIITNVDVVPETNGQSNGGISILAQGGNEPFMYSINGIAYQASNIFTGLPAGNYTGSVKDANGCIVEFEFIINNITGVNELHATFNLYPNPAASEIFIHSDEPVSIRILDLHGHMLWQTNKSDTHQIDVQSLAAGCYFLRISDEYGSTFRKIFIE